MLTTESFGIVPASTPMTGIRHVKVVRSFMFKGEPTKVGSVLELDRVFASELISAGKAEPYTPPPVEPEAPKAPEAEAAPVSRRGRAKD